MRLALLLLLVSTNAYAFPELVRFGYNNCTACHVSPAGGGLLTSYGRSLSAEVLATWGNEANAGLFWGAGNREKLEKWLQIGGDVRAVQVYQENEVRKKATFVKMQAAPEIGFVRNNYGAVISIGEFQDQSWKPNARTFYAYAKPRDELSVRGGRFVPSYGLRIPDHIAFTRSFLGLGLTGIRDSLEVQWTGETLTLNATHSKEFDTDAAETANSVQAQVYLAEKYKLAANYWTGTAPGSSRNITGFWGVFGFTKRLYWLSEVDLQNQKLAGAKTQSFVSYQRLGYTLFKGFDLIWISEHLHSNLSVDNSITNRNGPGIQFYPLPHLELSAAFTKQESLAAHPKGDNYAWILFHYYL